MSELRLMAFDAGLVTAHPDAAFAVVSEHRPDVVAITGAPRYQRWRSKRAKIARQLGLVVATTDRVGGMFIATSLRVDPKRTTFQASSSSAGTSPAVITMTFEVRGEDWRVVLAATGGAAEFAEEPIPTVVVGGVGGPAAITADRALTVVSCGPVAVPGLPQARPTLAVLER
ncbi:MAG TPA: hypothetical protein VG899_08135 [Mycobacteriales bacterium]|nr:hypothetical protein [Mycobacteriales bacterium]